MKPRRIQKSSKPTLQDQKVVDNGHKSASKSRAKASGETCPVPNNKPFTGKVFYLDLPRSKRAEALENDIKKLGGTIEKFFSKEIKYLVSNKREARYVQYLGRDSPVPSPDSGHSSPHPQPGSHRAGGKGGFHGQADTVVTSRGKSLVERVVKEQERIQMNKILSNALEWGVKILYIDDIVAYVEKKRKASTTHTATTAAVKKSAKTESTGRQAFQKYKAGRIKKPFVKVEDSSRHYRPICLALPNMPEFNLRSAAPCSPFYMEDKDQQGKKPRDHRNRGTRASASEERARVRPRKNREKKRAGYCECCMLKYDNVKAHFQSEHHRAFAKSDEYLVVDRLASTLPFNFLYLKAPNKRPKCSVSSVLRAPGLSTKTGEDGPRAAAGNETERALASLRPAAEETRGGGNPPKHSSLPPPVPDGEGRDCDDLPDRDDGLLDGRQRPVSRKRPRRRGAHHTRTLRPWFRQRHGSKAETAPSGGDPSNHDTSDTDSALARGDRERTCVDSNRLGGGGGLQRGVPSASLAARDEQSPTPLEAGAPGRCVAAGRCAANTEGVSEGKESSALTHSPSPVGRLRRRVRDFKRKRRKVDTQAVTQEHGKPSDIPVSSVLNLWQLFQSSEDMDWEFRGFK